MKLLKDVSDRTDPTPGMKDSGGSKYLKDPKYYGNPNAERRRVIQAILDIVSKTKE